MMDFETARAKMVDNQIRTTDVTSHSVLKAFVAVPREAFVPAANKQLAYIDEDILICPARDGRPARYMMEASPLAKLLQLAEISREDVVLEVGCGTGYVAALLSLLAGSVVSIDSDEDLVNAAAETLSSLGYDNVAAITADLEKGYPSEAPYDLIFINGAVQDVPAVLIEQLRDGGRLVAVVGYGAAAKATVFRKHNKGSSSNTFFNASIKPLPGFVQAKEFVF